MTCFTIYKLSIFVVIFVVVVVIYTQNIIIIIYKQNKHSTYTVQPKYDELKTF